MAKKERNDSSNGTNQVSASVDELLLAALERNDNSFETGRYIATLNPDAGEEGLGSLGKQGMRLADARDFNDQATILENVGDADAVIFPEINVALISGNAAQERNMNTFTEIASDSSILSIDPEYFVFSDSVYGEFLQTSFAQAGQNTSSEYLRGFLQATETIAREMKGNGQPTFDTEEDVQVLGATWGLNACKVPPSVRSGLGIKVAVLDTGFDLGHPDFAGRPIVSATFVGQPVQDLNGHGTHTTGTATGPKAPAGNIPRYGVGFRSSIFVGKVLTNAGSGTTATVLAGMNWAIANRCPVISMSLGGPGGPQPAYTNAGQAALNNGCLIIAAAGNTGPNGATGAPANSPTIMSVASLDPNLSPSSFSSRGKVEIAGPGRDVFSSWPRPTLYRTISGTSMATPHVSGCAALWAETSPNLRGLMLWRRLVSTARPLPFPRSIVGAGLVQAP